MTGSLVRSTGCSCSMFNIARKHKIGIVREYQKNTKAIAFRISSRFFSYFAECECKSFVLNPGELIRAR